MSEPMTVEDACEMVSFIKTFRNMIEDNYIEIKRADGSIITTEDVNRILRQLTKEIN